MSHVVKNNFYLCCLSPNKSLKDSSEVVRMYSGRVNPAFSVYLASERLKQLSETLLSSWTFRSPTHKSL